jgi:hypothetical protein
MEGRAPYLLYGDFQLTFLVLFLLLGVLTLLRGFVYSYATIVI